MIPSPPAAPARAGRRRLLLALAAPLAAVGFLGVSASPATAAPRPAGVAGDPHSPTVAMLAEAALAARDVYAFAGDPASFRVYQERLGATAAAVAVEFAADPVAVDAAFAGADLAHQTAVLAALSQLGVAYRHATSEPGVGFDCSGLTAFAWSRAGVELPNQSSAQMDAAPRVEHGTAGAGDLVQYPGHVMLYLGFGDAVVHAANEASDVELATAGDRSLNWADPAG